MPAVQVVGGGLAGSTAALRALMHGAPVTIIEKSRLPRHKVCGEFLSPEIHGVLTQLNCLDEFLALDPATIRRMTLHFGSIEKRSVLTEPAFGLSRFALDRFLFETAIARGARAVRETWTGHVGSQAGSEANVVLATGRKAIAPAGRDRLFGFKAHFTGPVDDAVELFFFDGCYAGVSQVEQGITNISGLAPERLLRTCSFNADELMARSRPLAERLRPLSRSMPWLTVGPLVFSRSFDARAAENVYPAGDALGFTDPFTGSGMLSAVLTGSMAGQAAALGVPVPIYLRDCRRALGRPFQISAIFRTLLESGLAPWLAAPIPWPVADAVDPPKAEPFGPLQRLNIMDLLKCETLAKADPWLAYRCAFEDFSEKARQVQSLTVQPDFDHAAMQTALLELEQALAEYRNSRDAVVKQLLPPPHRVVAA